MYERAKEVGGAAAGWAGALGGQVHLVGPPPLLADVEMVLGLFMILTASGDGLWHKMQLTVQFPP